MTTNDDRPISDFAPVALRPQRTRAAAWTVLAVLVMAAAVWFLLDMGAGFFPIAFLLVASAPLVFFGAQLFWPDQFTVRLEPDELEIQQFWRHRTIAWEHVRRARVARAAGEHVLELDAPDAGGLVSIMLPVGCDLDAMHRFLRARLGLTPEPADVTEGMG
jgi:hypothetical protein